VILLLVQNQLVELDQPYQYRDRLLMNQQHALQGIRALRQMKDVNGNQYR